jgi:hypothetical protein
VANNKKEFRLIVQMVQGKYFRAGPYAGLGIAYYRHAKSEKSVGKVILDIKISRRGFGRYKPDIKIWKSLMQKPGQFIKYNGDLIKISKIGYIYESKEKGITWQFNLEGILNFKDMSKTEKKEYMKFYPKYIRDKWKKYPDFPGGYKPLVSSLKKLKTPITVNNDKANKFKKYSQKNRAKNLLPIGRGGNTFVHKWPDLYSRDFYKDNELNSEFTIDQYLKTILEKPPTEPKAMEATIHEIIETMLIEKQYYVVHEGSVEKGRFDFLVRDKNGDYFAIEVKIGNGNGAAKQLSGYITELKNNLDSFEIPNNAKIKGIILSGNPSEKARKEADNYGYQVWTYNLGIKIPELEKI